MFQSYTMQLRHFQGAIGGQSISEIFLPVDLTDVKRVMFCFDLQRIVSAVHTAFIDTGNLNAPSRNMTPVNSNISTVFTGMLNVETGITSQNIAVSSRRVIAGPTTTTGELMETVLNVTADLARNGIVLRYISGDINEAPVLFQFTLEY